jgi:hypothetical protein
VFVVISKNMDYEANDNSGRFDPGNERSKPGGSTKEKKHLRLHMLQKQVKQRQPKLKVIVYRIKQ